MLTPKQRRLLEIIEEGIEQNGVAPSYEEARDALGLRSKSSIHRMMQSLAERGYVRRLPHRARALEVLRPSRDAWIAGPAVESDRVPPGREIPLMGYVAAGVPVVVWETSHRYVGVPWNWVSTGSEYFALQVKGESMTGAGIVEGDIAVVRRQPTAEDGDIVVALVDNDETTLKRFRRDSGRQEIVLEAENPDFEDIRRKADRISVQGKLTGLLRNYR